GQCRSSRDPQRRGPVRGDIVGGVGNHRGRFDHVQVYAGPDLDIDRDIVARQEGGVATDQCHTDPVRHCVEQPRPQVCSAVQQRRARGVTDEFHTDRGSSLVHQWECAWTCGAIGPGSCAWWAPLRCTTTKRRTQSHSCSVAAGSFVDTASTGSSPRTARASVTIRSGSTPTCGARSVLLTTSRSARSTPGPPLRATSPPPATSIQKICASTNAGLNVAVRLSPPLSTNTT